MYKTQSKIRLLVSSITASNISDGFWSNSVQTISSWTLCSKHEILRMLNFQFSEQYRSFFGKLEKSSAARPDADVLTFHGKLRLKSFTCGLVPWYLTQSDNFWRLKIDSFSKPIAPLMLSRCLNLWDDMTHWDQTAVSFLVSSVRSGNLRFIYLSPWRAIYTASLYYAQLTELCKTAHF